MKVSLARFLKDNITIKLYINYIIINNNFKYSKINIKIL